jgi:peptidase inhibitor family I36
MDMKRAVLFTCMLSAAAASPALAQRWGHGSFPRDGVCFYKDPDFRGDYFCVGAGEELTSVGKDMNDEVSSLKVFGNAEVTVFKDVRFAGRSSRFDFDVRNLKDSGWDDLISSLRVRSRSGGFGSRPGPPARPTEDPDRIVRRAYQDILDRQPDPTGMRIYRSHILDDGWSEAQVREALRDSPEYREKNSMTPAKAQDIVRRAYLAVLKREPDPGSRPFVDRVMRDHWTQQDVERELRKSPEYRQKDR